MLYYALVESFCQFNSTWIPSYLSERNFKSGISRMSHNLSIYCCRDSMSSTDLIFFQTFKLSVWTYKSVSLHRIDVDSLILCGLKSGWKWLNRAVQSDSSQSEVRNLSRAHGALFKQSLSSFGLAENRPSCGVPSKRHSPPAQAHKLVN